MSETGSGSSDPAVGETGSGSFDLLPMAEVSEDVAAAAVTVATRFRAGATMWTAAPEWPAHADHLAVEFVHPVIVGKRALPAVHVAGPEPLRLLARPGDLLVALAGAGHAGTRDLLRRAEAWGLTRIWLGAGARPPERSAEHLVWLDDTGPDLAARTGDLVLLYHLLWELTHVVFEHHGLGAPARDPRGGPGSDPLGGAGCGEEVCITCSDEGRVAEVRRVDRSGSAEVVIGGLPGTVDVSLVEEVAPGDLLLVHAGVALTALRPTSAPGVGER